MKSTIVSMKTFWISILLLFVAVPVTAQSALDVSLEMSEIAEDLVGVNVHNWLDVFAVTVQNHEDFPVQYRIVFSMTLTNSSVANGEIVSGYTQVGTERYDGLDGAGILAADAEATLTKESYQMGHLYIDPTFNGVLYSSGVLPSGDYEIDIRMQVDEFGDGEELYFIDPQSSQVHVVELSLIERTVTLPSPPILSLPSDQTVVNQSNPTFSWFSIKAAPGLKVRYKITICLREEDQSYEEAMDNLPFWTNDWGGLNIYGDDPVPGNGSSFNLSWTYPADADQMQAGREYVWQVSAYDVDGVYGWDEASPAVSEIWAFYFGSPPSLITPSNNSRDVGSVRPTFTWSSVQGAYDYEIWFGDQDDPEVEAPFWDAIVTSSNYRYPLDAPGLVPNPNHVYYWKVRTNPSEVVPGDWSDPIYSFAIEGIELLAPSDGATETTVLPNFNWRSPNDVYAFEFRISTVDDPEVEAPFYSAVTNFPPFRYPVDAPPLQPGESYHWKILALDQNEEIVGRTDEYGSSGFTIQDFEYSAPLDGGNVLTLTPLFSWNAPANVPGFELQITTPDDPLFELPIFTTVLQSRSLQIVGNTAGLVPGRSYLWRVVALDASEVVIAEYESYTSVASFTIQAIDLLTPQNDETVNTCRPFFSWKALQGVNRFQFLIGAADDPAVESPLLAYAVTGVEHLLYPADVELELCCTDREKSYYWKILCLDEGDNIIGNPEDYPVSLFSIQDVILREPGNGVTVNTLTPLFTWEKPQYMPGCYIQIADAEDPQVDAPFANIFVAGQSFTPTLGELPIGPGATYYWTVYPADQSNNECPLGMADIHSFRTQALTIASPAGNQAVDDACPTLRWDIINGAAVYEIVVTDESSSQEVLREQANTSPYHLTRPLGPGQSYSWQITALDNDGNPIGASSQREYFSIAPIELTSPVSNSELLPAVVSSIQPVFRWQSPSCIAQFQITVIDGESNQVWYQNGEIYGVSFTYPRDARALQNERSYRWNIQAIHDDQAVGVVSASNTFQTPPPSEVPPPQIVSVSYEENRSNPTVSSELANGTDHYRVTFSWNAEISDVFYSEDDLTSAVYTYPESAPVIPYATQYYIQLEAFDSDGNPYGNPISISDVYSAISPAAALEAAPTLAVEIPQDSPRKPIFSWGNVPGATRYRLLVSSATETNDQGLIDPDLADLYINGTRFAWTDDQATLAYQTEYYSQVIGYDQAAISQPSSVTAFQTGAVEGAGDKPVLNVVFENPDPRIPTFYMGTAVRGANRHILQISRTDDMTDIIWTSDPVTQFPYKYPDEAERLAYATNYYLEAQAYIDDATHGQPSEVSEFRTGAQPGAEDQPGYEVHIVDTNPLTPVFTIIARVTNATGYRFTLAEDPDFGSVIWTSTSVSDFPYSYPADAPGLEYNTEYYTQAQGYLDANPHGLPSNTVPITTGVEPGSDERPGLDISFGADPLLPIFTVTDAVTGADAYVYSIATDATMNEILWTSAAISTIPYPYPGDPALEYGGIYYARANARKGGTDHGLPGEIVLFQVPQRTRPVLMDSPLFSWNATDPPSVRYLVEVSRLEDMSTTVWSESSPTTQLDYPAGVFDWSTTYYWRVTGFDTADEIVGVPSDVGFFVTESVDPPVLISPVDAEVETLTPTFRWNSVAQADQYELLLSANNDLSVPFWTVELRGTSVRYPEDALRLEEEKNYYWQLFALDADGEPISDGSAIASFSVAALAQVELTEPVNTTINTVTPHFKWSNVAGVRQYRLQLATNADLSDQVLEIETRSQQYAHSGSPALNRGAVYYWQVNALDRNNELYGKPSEIASFSIAEPNTVTLLSPVDVTIEDLQPQFRWTELAGAETYAFELQKAGQSIVSAEVPNTRLQLTGSQRLEYGSSYQWSIQALDGDAIPVGNRAEAGFQTAAQRKVTLLSPVDAEVSSSRPFFEWQGISDVPGYRMELLEADNDGILWTVSTSQTRVQYPGDPPLVMDTDYRWRVISLDQESRPIGEWSDVAQFRMTNRYLITLTSPVGETVYTLNPTFSWQVNENIARYKITVAEDDALSTVLWSMDEIQTARIQYPSLGVPQLAYGSTYFWTIQGLAEDGTALGDPSGVASFPVSGMRIPEPIAPVEVQVQTLNPNFSWSEVDGAFEYSLLVASDEGLSQVMYQNPHIADLGISYPTSGAIPLEFEKTYYWQIQAFDNNGSPVGDPSQVVLFTTPSSMVEIIIEFGS